MKLTINQLNAEMQPWGDIIEIVEVDVESVYCQVEGKFEYQYTVVKTGRYANADDKTVSGICPQCGEYPARPGKTVCLTCAYSPWRQHRASARLGWGDGIRRC